MRRSDRLFELIQLFRTGRLLRGADIAERLEVSLRTIYRDIDTLIASGVPIEGERGVGYLLREPIFLPPLTLAEAELDALHFALDHAQRVGDASMAASVEALKLKFDAVLPARRQSTSFVRAMSNFAPPVPAPSLAALRKAIRDKQKIELRYVSLDEQCSERRVRPLQLEWWGVVWTLTAWCELRGDFRVFRVDRIEQATPAGGVFQDEAGKRYKDYLALVELKLAQSKEPP